jgi:fucokinase
MAFVSTTLCEMASDFKSVRSGPSLNTNWLYAYQLIENSQIEKAIIELSKVRQNWMHRSDLLIRASRHYEGAMLAFIRQAISSFKTTSSESNVIFFFEYRFY